MAAAKLQILISTFIISDCSSIEYIMCLFVLLYACDAFKYCVNYLYNILLNSICCFCWFRLLWVLIIYALLFNLNVLPLIDALASACNISEFVSNALLFPGAAFPTFPPPLPSRSIFRPLCKKYSTKLYALSRTSRPLSSIENHNFTLTSLHVYLYFWFGCLS